MNILTKKTHTKATQRQGGHGRVAGHVLAITKCKPKGTANEPGTKSIAKTDV